MKNNFGSISNIAQVHNILGLEPPTHPLITILEKGKFTEPVPIITKPIPSELYAISLKNGSECSLSYGRRKYDFQQGSLLFLSPGQSFITVANSNIEQNTDFNGWTLVFHSDLIMNSSLGAQIDNYSFFSYRSNEALHLSKNERVLLSNIIESIKTELEKDIDHHSNGIIVTYIELLLKYSVRFYSRQFITRSNENYDILIRFETFLKNYIDAMDDETTLLSVKACAKEMGYSPNYLSDLLKKETGKTAQEHIYFHVLQKAKLLLRTTSEPVYNIAASLGFEYPQHFSHFFKEKIGLSPTIYRKEYSSNY